VAAAAAVLVEVEEVAEVELLAVPVEVFQVGVEVAEAVVEAEVLHEAAPFQVAVKPPFVVVEFPQVDQQN